MFKLKLGSFLLLACVFLEHRALADQDLNKRIGQHVLDAAASYDCASAENIEFLARIVSLSSNSSKELIAAFEVLLNEADLDEETRDKIRWTLFVTTRVKFRLPDHQSLNDGVVMASVSDRVGLFYFNPSWPVGTDSYGNVFLIPDAKQGVLLYRTYHPLAEFRRTMKYAPERRLLGVSATPVPMEVYGEPALYYQKIYDELLHLLPALPDDERRQVIDAYSESNDNLESLRLAIREIRRLGRSFEIPPMRSHGSVIVAEPKQHGEAKD